MKKYMMAKKRLFSFLSLWCVSLAVFAQDWQLVSHKSWRPDAEDRASTKVSLSYVASEFVDGVWTIASPKGATLWCSELMEGNTVIEYEARIVPDEQFKDENGNLRVSDLNCFWMADNMKPKGGSGKFLNNYALKMYYVGYGGNWNTTTRFRRYTGDARGVSEAEYRPGILKEYTDSAHLLKPNHWYKIRLEQIDGHARYFIDGECLVDYVDPQPLTRGYFGFRTTMAKAQLRNFRYVCEGNAPKPIVLRWVGSSENGDCGPATFGVPFLQGECQPGEGFQLVTVDGEELPLAHHTIASWPDGSVKWESFTTVSQDYCDTLLLKRSKSRQRPKMNQNPVLDEPVPFSVVLNDEECAVLKQEVESRDELRTVRRYEGRNFIVRTYQYAGSEEMKLVHTLLVDSALNADGLRNLAIRFKVPIQGKPYERAVHFGTTQHDERGFNDMKFLSVQPLVARRNIDLKKMDPTTVRMLENIAQWDGFRLSQLSPNGYSIRKRATKESPWIGTMEGRCHDGTVIVFDAKEESTKFRLKDFWQSYPSTIQIDGMRSDTATVSIYLYSPEAEPYSFAHYDTIAHTLDAAYEDVQPGMSTALGIARTSTIYINEQSLFHSQLLPTPEYLHSRRAFGLWSLPTVESERDSLVEKTLSDIMAFYKTEIERHGWYGYFNYGDVMHGYDRFRDEWRYDVGGYAWDNTELGSPAMFWYMFLRSGDYDIWQMAEAMTRHCSEVDCYHVGPHAGLGSRHNVSHWGCGAKEARISEAWWNRFYFYLTGGDERTGDLMSEVVDSDTLLYTLDPMRLAQPRHLYPCSAPARLRVGPDWMAYASNWFTEWERSGSKKHFNKLQAGMNSIASLRHGFFDGPKALGYDPATGVITNECDTAIQNTNHLMPIMGGFELLNEMELSVPNEAFYAKWLDHNLRYKQHALKISRSRFLIPRLSAYAGWRLGDEAKRREAWDDLLRNLPIGDDRETLWTNDCVTWTLDAIFLKEVVNH